MNKIDGNGLEKQNFENDKKLVRQDESTPKMTRIGIQKYLVEQKNN